MAGHCNNNDNINYRPFIVSAENINNVIIIGYCYGYLYCDYCLTAERCAADGRTDGSEDVPRRGAQDEKRAGVAGVRGQPSAGSRAELPERVAEDVSAGRRVRALCPGPQEDDRGRRRIFWTGRVPCPVAASVGL